MSEGKETQSWKVLGPLQYSGGRRIENLWKPTCEAMWVPQSCRDLLSHVDKQEKGTWEPGSVTLVGFDSLPEILS